MPGQERRVWSVVFRQELRIKVRKIKLVRSFPTGVTYQSKKKSNESVVFRQELRIKSRKEDLGRKG